MLGLDLTGKEGPDVGGSHRPYLQSQRYNRHRELAQPLVAAGLAYRCYCSPDLLKKKREEAEAAKIAWKYDRTCLGLSAEQRRSIEASGLRPAIRFRVPEGATKYRDHVHGEIQF